MNEIWPELNSTFDNNKWSFWDSEELFTQKILNIFDAFEAYSIDDDSDSSQYADL